MGDKVQRVSYWHMEVPNKSGEGLKVLGALKEASVNLLSFTAFPVGGGRSELVLVPETIDAFTKAAKDAGLALSAKKEAFFIQGPERPGVVAEVLKKLADAKINIHAANAASGGTASYGFILWVKPEDFAAAARALGV
jgi:hypothetical protein